MNDLEEMEEVRRDLMNMAELIRLNVQRLSDDMTSGLAGSKGAGSNDKHVRAIKELTLAGVKLGQELRQWQRKRADKAKNLTKEQKFEVVVRFAESMPPPERKKLCSIILDMP